MRKVNVIYLNGSSSVGKTTVAKELQAILDEPYILTDIDHFLVMLPSRYTGADPAEERGISFTRDKSPSKDEVSISVGPVGRKFLSGFHNAIAALASAGNNVIVCHVLYERGWLDECVRVLSPFNVLFVGLHCRLHLAEARERARGDRTIGTARFRFDLMRSDYAYDMEIDTSSLGATECAEKIRQRLQEGPPPRAFDGWAGEVGGQAGL